MTTNSQDCCMVAMVLRVKVIFLQDLFTHFCDYQVKDDKAGSIFKACQVIFKYDIQTALYLLPYIVLCVLLDAEANMIDEVRL